MTAKNTIAFEMRMEAMKLQFTEFHSNSTSERNMSDGRANVPTNVFRPLDSAFVIMFRRPARYLRCGDGQQQQRVPKCKREEKRCYNYLTTSIRN